MIARAYMLKPKLIIADEPVPMVVIALLLMILNLMKSHRGKLETFFVYFTHDLAKAFQISDLIIILNKEDSLGKGTTRSCQKFKTSIYTIITCDDSTNRPKL